MANSLWPNTFVPTPQIDAQEHQEALMQPEQVEIVQENADARVVRNRKRGGRTWNVLISGPNGEVNRKRMRTTDIWKLPQDKRIVVEWNHWDQPIDDSGGILSRYLGTIVRDYKMLPIGYEKWSAVPQHYKDRVWNDIIVKFEVNDARHKNYIFKSIGKKWRDCRYNLYKMHIQLKNPLANYWDISEIWSHRYESIPYGQRDDFINYRARSDTKTKATQNTKNCKSLTMHHTLGSKSFARLENELKVEHGEPVTRVKLFQVAYTKEDGPFVNEKAKKNHEKLVIQSQTLSENDAYISVFGKEHPGYVRGLGLGAVKTQIYGSSSSSGSMSYSSGPTQVEFDAMKEEIKQLKEQIAMLTGQNFMPNQHTNME